MSLVVIRDTDTRAQLEQHIAELRRAERLASTEERAAKLRGMIDRCLEMWGTAR